MKTPEEIWEDNEKLSEELGRCYYSHIIEEYKKLKKKDSKENFGFNTFVDGIRLGLDIVLPLIDEVSRQKAIDKAKSMMNRRKEISPQTMLQLSNYDLAKRKIRKFKHKDVFKESNISKHMEIKN